MAIRRLRWRMKVLFCCAACMGFTVLWTFMTLLIIAAQEQSKQAPEGAEGQNLVRRDLLEQKGEEDSFAGNKIQVVVGHYNGKLPDQKKENLTHEELNANDYAPDWKAGELGHAVRLSTEEDIRSLRTFSINQFNLVASDKIPLNRTLPDVRKRPCRIKEYPPNLPTTSVIIVFHNEAFSTLLRTVTSVINRSPRSSLNEIILVDDASEREFLFAELEKIVAQFPVPVRIFRSDKRIGLIRARLLGAKGARGDILTFLDSHCECTEGWLEPLLARIKEDRTAVVCPVIDVINDRTFAYQRGIELFRGGFNWNLQFRWYSVPKEELTRRGTDPTAPIKSPTMAGGLFAIDRKYFEEMGTYDNHMDIWGGENLEMSFRVWQCGGSVEILPCSHVGHVFRKASPHDFPDKNSGKILNTNLVRVAEVWMDDWKHLFYKTAPQAEDLSKNIDVSERRELRDRLKCKDFAWYLDNVWPDNFMPKDGLFFGRIKHIELDMCLELAYVPSHYDPSRTEKRASLGACREKLSRLQISNTKTNQCITSIPGPPAKRKHTLDMKQCTLGFDYWQFWLFSSKGEIKSDEHQCLQGMEVSGNWIVQLKECAAIENEFWDYNQYRQQFVHRASQLCLDQPTTLGQKDETKTPSLKKCARDSVTQRFQMIPIDWKKPKISVD